jgi:cephalosporin hydroxylase
VLLIHDASHEAAVVIEDLRNYSPLIASGSYLIVEDGVIDTIWGVPGPVTAVNRFLEEASDFELDLSRERFGLTYNPRGFLRRR